VARPAVYALYFLRRYDCLSVIVVVVASFLHEIVQAVVANHIGAAIFAPERRDLTKWRLIFAIVAAALWLNIIIAYVGRARLVRVRLLLRRRLVVTGALARRSRILFIMCL